VAMLISSVTLWCLLEARAVGLEPRTTWQDDHVVRISGAYTSAEICSVAVQNRDNIDIRQESRNGNLPPSGASERLNRLSNDREVA